jgi:hypothetical protein
MKSATHLLLSSIFFLLLPLYASASLEFTEVMYDVEGTDKGHEWVRLTNTGKNNINLEGSRFFESGVNHKLTLVSGSWILAPSSSVVIADNAHVFKEDMPSYEGMLLDSSFSLSNEGESLKLMKGNTVVASTTYAATPKSKTQSPNNKSSKTYATSTTAALALSPSSKILGWGAGLSAIIFLGIAAYLLIPKREETFSQAQEFELVE